MVSRALSLAAVTLLIGFFATPCAWAQAQNLEAGKSPSQLFAGTCNACHKSPRGLLRTVSPGSLPGFLREHYTTSGDMASQLSAFLISNGAGEGRRQAKPDADTKPAGGADQVDRQGRKLRRAGSQDGSRPEVDPSPQASRNGQGPAQAATERGPDGRKLTAKQRLSKRSRPGSEEIPAAKDDQPKFEPAMDDKASGETVKREDGKAEEPKPSAEGKAEAARVEMPKEGISSETPALRADPSPATPAQPAASSPPPTPTSVGSIEPAAAQPLIPAPAPAPASAPAPSEKSAAVRASEPAAASQSASPPSSPPVAAAGSPAPPISQ
jgi:hypothetical protein